MKSNMSRFWVAFGAAVAIPLAVMAASPDNKPAEPAASIGLFDGIESGDIEVKVIPRTPPRGRHDQNKTGKPVTVKLPDVLAGVPVLAQGLRGGAGGLDGGRRRQ